MQEFYKLCLSYAEYEYRKAFYSFMAYGLPYCFPVVHRARTAEELLSDLLDRQMILAYRVGVPTKPKRGPVFVFHRAEKVWKFFEVIGSFYLRTDGLLVRPFILKGSGKPFRGKCPMLIDKPQDWKNRKGGRISVDQFVDTFCPLAPRC